MRYLLAIVQNLASYTVECTLSLKAIILLRPQSLQRPLDSTTPALCSVPPTFTVPIRQPIKHSLPYSPSLTHHSTYYSLFMMVSIGLLAEEAAAAAVGSTGGPTT